MAPLQQVLIFLKKILLTNPLLRTCRRFTWLLWSILTRRLGKGKGGKSLENDPDKAGRADSDRRREKSRKFQGTPQQIQPQPIIPPAPIRICASETPASVGLHPYSYNNPRATISSQELRPTTSATFRNEFNIKNSSYPRISHPTASGQVHGTVTRATASPAASVTRLSVSESQYHGPEEAASRFTCTASPAASCVSINVQPASAPAHAIEETFTESPKGSRRASRLSLAIDTTIAQPDRVEDQVSILGPEEFTSEPETIRIVNGRSLQGYDIGGPMTMSPIEASAHTTLDGHGNRPDTQTENLSEIYKDFEPMAPEIYYRYYKEDFIEPLVTTFELAPMTTSFQHYRMAGESFFTQKVPVTSSTSQRLVSQSRTVQSLNSAFPLHRPQKIYTDADIYNPNVHRHATRLINEFEEYTQKQNIKLSNNMNLTLDMFYEDDDSCPCRYYIADHSTRTVFWLDKFNADEMDVWSEVKGVTELTHIRHAIEAQYWYHCQLFPDSYRLDMVVVDELRDILTYWIGDVLTSMGSTIPYAIEELQQMLTLTNNLRKNVQGMRGAAAFGLCTSRQRFLDFHGQATVRLDRNKSIHRPADQPQKYSWLLGCLSPFMFSAPDTQLRELGKIWVDRCVHKAAWNKFISNMNSEWQELILFGTVLLNANVAFLAIQSVDEATSSPKRSPAQVLSFLSVVSSIGSVIIGLMLTRKNKVKHKEGATDAAIFLNSFEAERLGLETLAILYSVPYAFLMWGVVLFLAAFSFFCLNEAALSVRLIVPTAWIIISFLVVWCIFTLSSWDSRFNAQNRSAWDRVIEAIKDTFNKTVDATKNKMIASGILESVPETPVLRLRSSPVRRMSEMWRKASRRATFFSAFSALGSGNRGGSRRVTEEVEVRHVPEGPRASV
ncbi:hypothetical protein PQX77_005874 [Marasmius sp. AFHP31]|nr:hypothetical protein PQX77_005874 [Marasmius sp. AFHP31]